MPTVKLHEDCLMKFSSYKSEKWIAPKDLREGSLSEPFARWIELTDNLEWAHDPQADHASYFPKLLGEKMLLRGIHLKFYFFNQLEDNVENINNIISQQQFLELFIRVLKKTNNPFIQVKEFKKML
jgi:hypothetical protein